MNVYIVKKNMNYNILQETQLGEQIQRWFNLRQLGFFCQLLINQGQKLETILELVKVFFGAQHSPQVVILEDDTAIIGFIEGNSIKEAMIKGLRFNNKLEIVGNNQLFTTFSVNYFVLNNQFINKIVSLKNGGFAIYGNRKIKLIHNFMIQLAIQSFRQLLQMFYALVN